MGGVRRRGPGPLTAKKFQTVFIFIQQGTDRKVIKAVGQGVPSQINFPEEEPSNFVEAK